VNTVGTSTLSATWRIKYFQASLQKALRNALVSEKICNVDRSDAKYLSNPYGNQPSATVAAVSGGYSVSAWTTTDDTISVTDQVTYAEHIYEFESTMTRVDLAASRIDEMSYAIAYGIDYFVINKVTDVATGAYTTPAGGFTTPSNIPEILANIASQVMGYSQSYNGLFLVIENTDVVGFMQAQMAAGFSYADAALNNGFMTSMAGIDIYVVRTGTFATGTIGTLTATNSGHRLAGIKGIATYLAPRGVQMEEKSVTAKTGKEIAVYGNVGAGIWVPLKSLLIDITIA
jgi:hypothetical protein